MMFVAPNMAMFFSSRAKFTDIGSKHTTRSARALVKQLQYRLDVNSLHREVGADRIANAVGAADLYEGPIVVIDFGTATTYDAVSGRGEYLGGVIAPGVEISLDALYTRAAALRRVELVEPRSVIGRTTVESIQAGALYGFAGQVDGICRRMAEELGDLTVVATMLPMLKVMDSL